MRKKILNKEGNNYLTNFFRCRSIIALCCCISTMILAFIGIISGVIRTIEVVKINGFYSFIFFTMISNTLALCSVAFVVPYAVDGIKKKRFILPKWVAVMHYISVSSITIMMAFVVIFISWIAPNDAFGGSNLITHVFCPILILISFFQIENNYIYSVKDRFIGCIPICIYIVLYFFEVVVIGEKNGGWPDIYHIQDYTSPAIAMCIVFVLGLSVTWIIASISNYFTKIREKKMFKYWKKDVDVEDAKKEAYRIGNMMSKIKDKNCIDIPLDILECIAKKSNQNINDLVMSYIKGLISGQQESNKQEFKNIEIK